MLKYAYMYVSMFNKVNYVVHLSALDKYLLRNVHICRLHCSHCTQGETEYNLFMHIHMSVLTNIWVWKWLSRKSSVSGKKIK